MAAVIGEILGDIRTEDHAKWLFLVANWVSGSETAQWIELATLIPDFDAVAGLDPSFGPTVLKISGYFNNVHGGKLQLIRHVRNNRAFATVIDMYGAVVGYARRQGIDYFQVTWPGVPGPVGESWEQISVLTWTVQGVWMLGDYLNRYYLGRKILAYTPMGAGAGLWSVIDVPLNG